MNERPHAVALPSEGERIVEVLGRVRVDREHELVAQVDPAFIAWLGQLVGLELDARALLDEQTLEHVLDRLCRAEHALDRRSTARLPHDGEIARANLAQSLAVDHELSPWAEERLADD